MPRGCQNPSIEVNHGARKVLTNQQLLTTDEAAAFLQFAPQTLRKWACYGSGPVRPVKVQNRLRWRLADLEKLAAGSR